MAEVATITVLDSQGVEREVPTLLSAEGYLADIQTAVESTTPVAVFATGDTLAVVAVTCTGAADLLLAGAAGRKSVLIASLPDSAVAYLGPSGVATTDGVPIYPGEKMVWPLGNAALYGATASGTANLRIATVI